MAVSFYIQNYTDTTANIFVTPDSRFTAYRVFVRKASDASDVTYSQWFYPISYSFSAYVTGLEPGTRYLANVAYGSYPDAAVSEWLDPATFTTEGSQTTNAYYVTLSFDANGGYGAPSDISFSGTSPSLTVTLPAVQPVRTGYTFTGWATSSTAASAQYYPGYTYGNWWGSTDPSYRLTLYAVWAEDGGGVWVYTNYGWQTATPYIFYNGGWQKATPYIYDGGWRKAT